MIWRWLPRCGSRCRQETGRTTNVNKQRLQTFVQRPSLLPVRSLPPFSQPLHEHPAALSLSLSASRSLAALIEALSLSSTRPSPHHPASQSRGDLRARQDSETVRLHCATAAVASVRLSWLGSPFFSARRIKGVLPPTPIHPRLDSSPLHPIPQHHHHHHHNHYHHPPSPLLTTTTIPTPHQHSIIIITIIITPNSPRFSSHFPLKKIHKNGSSSVSHGR